MSLRILLAVLVLPLTVLAAEPWLLSFPDISFDSSRVYFSGERWTAVYSPSAKGLAIRARDAVKNLPLPPKPADQVTLGASNYLAQENTLLSSFEGGPDTTRTLPDPTADAIACLSAAGGDSAVPASVKELIGPVTASNNKVWFGLTLGEVATRGTLDSRGFSRIAGGIGWYDPESNRFGRVYSPVLAGYKPQWIGARQDSIFLLFSQPQSGRSPESKLMVYLAKSSTLTEVKLQEAGVPGDYVMAVALWKDTLLLATNKAVALWKPLRKAEIWQSRAYQAPETQWLYLKTFSGGDSAAMEPVEFIPFKSGLPLEVRAKVGDWMQVFSPIVMTGYITREDWEKNSALWSQHSWNCGDNPCFARVKVDVHDKLVDADFMNTAFKEQDRERDRVKVSFRAGWAREEDLVPVMVAP